MAVCGSREPNISDRTGFNRRFKASHLEEVFTPRNDDELVDAVKRASTSANPGEDPGVRVVSGGHCYENLVYNPGCRCLIDCVGLARVGHDADRGYYVESGATIWSSFRKLHSLFDKFLPGGSCHSVGIGGHIAGGGFGLFSRLHGLTTDWLTGADIVVTPSPGVAKLLQVDASSDSELFWALRGAGCGNFGVISRFYFRELPRAPEKAEIVSLEIPWEDISDAETLQYVARHLHDAVHTGNPETEPVYWGLFGITKFNHQLRTGTRVSGAIEYLLQNVNPEIDIKDIVRGITSELASLGIRVKECPVPARHQLASHAEASPATPVSSGHVFTFHDAVKILNGLDDNEYSKHKSAYHKYFFATDQFEPLFAGLTEYPTHDGDPVDMSRALVQADSYGGKINLVNPSSTPIWQRQSTMKLQYHCHWESPSPVGTPDTRLDRVYIDWLNSLYHNVYQGTGGWPDPYFHENPDASPYQGCYYNYCDRELGTNEQGEESIDFAMQMYFGKENYQRLVNVKRTYDPYNIWNSSQSIPLKV